MLDYLRTFRWPALILVLLFGYSDKIWNLMASGEFELAGVLKLGRQVSQIKENTNEGLGDTRALLATVQNGDVSTSRIVEDIEAKLGKVELNLDHEVRQTRSEATDVPVRSKSAQQSIRAAELANAKALATAQG